MGYYENITNEDNKTFVDFYIKYYNTFDEKRLYDINNKAADLIARSPENCNYFDEFFTMLTDGEFVNVMIIMNAKEISTIKRMIVTGVSKEDIINSINSKYIKKYVKNWDVFIDAIDKYVTIDISSIVDPPKAEPIEVDPPKVESTAAKNFNPNVFLEKPVVQQNIMQPQVPQQVQQPVYQAPQPKQHTPQSVVLHPQCRPGGNVQILNYVPINPMEYNGFFGLFVDQFNKEVYLPVARPIYSNIESGLGCLLDNNGNNDTTKIVEFLRKHVKFINAGNNFTITEALSIINLIKNNIKVKEYCTKYESLYNPAAVILNEVTNQYNLNGTKFNKVFSIDTQDPDHPIIIFFNTKPYYNGIVNGWINESAFKVK